MARDAVELAGTAVNILCENFDGNIGAWRPEFVQSKIALQKLEPKLVTKYQLLWARQPAIQGMCIRI